MKKEIIATANAPQAIGPYSQAVRAGSFVYTAGQIGINPETSQMVAGGVTEQAEQVMKNLAAVLEASGTGLENVIKTTIFLRYMKDFSVVNEIYGRHFVAGKPARSTVAVSALPLQALVEIEVVALIPGEEPVQKSTKGKKKSKKEKKVKGKGKQA